jgi:hypothetical protein
MFMKNHFHLNRSIKPSKLEKFNRQHRHPVPLISNRFRASIRNHHLLKLDYFCSPFHDCHYNENFAGCIFRNGRSFSGVYKFARSPHCRGESESFDLITPPFVFCY